MLSRGGRILLLGPDDEHRRSLHVMLDHVGYDVAALAELDAAMRFLAERDCRAVIAPAALAASVAASVHQQKLRSPVIAVVQSRELGPSLAALDAGADDVVREPVDESLEQGEKKGIRRISRNRIARRTGRESGEGAGIVVADGDEAVRNDDESHRPCGQMVLFTCGG